MGQLVIILCKYSIMEAARSIKNKKNIIAEQCTCNKLFNDYQKCYTYISKHKSRFIKTNMFKN